MVHLLLLAVALQQGFDSRNSDVAPSRSDESARSEVVLILKTLTAERSVLPGSPSRITIGIILDRENAGSLRRARAMASEFVAAQEHLDRRIDVSMVEVRDGMVSDPKGAQVVYVTPVGSGSIEPIVQWTRRHRLLSFTSVAEYVERGLAVGVESKGKIIVNRTACRAVGAEFSSRLLRVARVID